MKKSGRSIKPASGKRAGGCLAALFRIGYWVVVAVFLVAYIARFFHPRYFWWAELFSIGLPYISLLLVLYSVPVFVGGGRFLKLTHLFILIAIFWRFVPVERLVDRSPEGKTLTVLTYNVPHYYGPYGDTERANLMMDLVRDNAPDVVALQEAGISYRPRYKARLRSRPYVMSLADSLGYQSPGPAPSKVTFTNQPVFGKVQFLNQSRAILREGRPEDGQAEVIRSEFIWEGRKVALYNVHMRSYGPAKPWQLERRSWLERWSWTFFSRQYRNAYFGRAWEAEQFYAILQKERLPFIVCGDMNSTPHNYIIHYLISAFKLQDAFFLAGDGWGSTYHSKAPFARIDYVLASPEWYVVDAEVPRVTLSDHRPVLAKLMLRPQR